MGEEWLKVKGISTNVSIHSHFFDCMEVTTNVSTDWLTKLQWTVTSPIAIPESWGTGIPAIYGHIEDVDIINNGTEVELNRTGFFGDFFI